jgi:DNA-binding IclR family transcriptional regulator
MSTPTAAPGAGLQTLDRALAILALFDARRPEWTAAEVGRELGLTLPTASRFMRGLEARGLLMRIGERRYRLGFSAIDLGQRALRTLELREPLRPVLLDLAQESGATALLAALTERGDAARIIDRADGGSLVRIALEIGHVWPLHAGAMAKALLAHHPDRDALVRRPLRAIGRNTITDARALADELEEVRRRGWAFSSEETEVGAWGVAAPVLGPSGRPLCSLGLVEPLPTRTAEEERRLVALARQAVARAEARLRA